MKIKQEIVDKFKSLKEKIIKEVTADTPEVGLDGNYICIKFTDDNYIGIRTKDFVEFSSDKNKNYES